MRAGCNTVRDRKGRVSIVDGIATVDIIEIAILSED